MGITRRSLLQGGAAGAVLAGLGSHIGSLFRPRKANAALFGAPTFQDVYDQIGRYIYLVPGKFAGSVAAYDMSTGKTLAFANMAIWAGNPTPIVHHMAAFASPDPYKEFEFVVNSQGGKNLYIYGVTTPVKDPYEGFNIWRVQYDGTKMNIMEDVAETTGLGLGVHVTVAPDNERFCVCDGQKDIMGIFRRGKGNSPSTVEAAVSFDWEYNNSTLKKAWSDGGTLRIRKLKPPYDYRGLRGLKIDWELVPGGELFAEDGKVPGPRLKNLCALDALGWDPKNKNYGIAALRLLGSGVVFDTRTWEPKAVTVGSDKFKKQGYQIPLNKVASDEWTAKFPFIPTPAHQAGYNPSGERYVLMNNSKENIMAVFDSTDQRDPTNWRRIAGIGDPKWRGAYPNPFHMAFTPDLEKMYVTLWWPPPTPNTIGIVDMKKYKLIGEHVIGADTHTVGITYDGKWAIGVFSGYQKTETGLYVVRVEDDKFYGFLPSPFGHHDSVVVPRTPEELAISRCPTT